MPLMLMLMLVSVLMLVPEEASPPKGRARVRPAVREVLREQSALWAQEKLVV